MAAYWRGDDTGERSICLVFGLFFFVVAMAVLVIDESLLDFGLDKGGFYHGDMSLSKDPKKRYDWFDIVD